MKKLFSSVVLAMLFGISFAQFNGKPQYQILTTRAGNYLGTINVELFPLIAPNHVKNFDSLVSTVFFDTTAFHRVIPGFVIQGGDPNSRHGPKSTWGYGDPSQPTVNAEFSPCTHLRGTLAAARDANINSANSQFYICVAPQPGLDGQYTIYGRVYAGMDIVDTIVASPRDVNDCPFQKIEMFVTYTGDNDSVPIAPLLKAPVSGTQGVGTGKTLQWYSNTGDVLFHVEVSTDSTFATIFKSQDVGKTYWQVTALNDSSLYYWRVKTCNGGHWSTDYSQVWNFSTIGYDVAVNNLPFLEKGFRLEQNIPNPVNGQTTIKYFTPEKENIIISLYDVEGKEISVLVNEEKQKGEHQFILDMNKFSAGTYFYRMQARDVSCTKKLILEK